MMSNRVVAGLLSAFIVFGGFLYLTRLDHGLYVSALPGFLGYIALLFIVM